MYESQAANFNFQLTRDSKYFIPYNRGGYSKYTNVRNKDSLLPNCTGGAYGLAMQLMGTTDYKDVDLPKDHAGNWYKYNTSWKKSKFPVVGAIACWSNGSKGHVGLVRKVERNSNGNVIGTPVILESSYYSYNKKDWREGKNYKYNANTGTLTKSGYKFQGYLLCPNVQLDPLPTTALKVGDKVSIVGKGNSRKDGKGKTCGGIGWTRKVLKVFPTYKYPYQIGNDKGVITGYYTADALKKL